MFVEDENDIIARFYKLTPKRISKAIQATFDNHTILYLVFGQIVGEQELPLFKNRHQLTLRILMHTCWNFYDLFKPFVSTDKSFTYLAYQDLYLTRSNNYSVVCWLDSKKENCNLILESEYNQNDELCVFLIRLGYTKPFFKTIPPTSFKRTQRLIRFADFDN